MNEQRPNRAAAPLAALDDGPAPTSLASLRARLDAVDAGLHELLVERCLTVERIAATKGPQGKVIRPDREAAVLAQRLAANVVPVSDTLVAALWRHMISAACALQKPYRAHVAPGTASVAAFLHASAPLVEHDSAERAIAALRDAPSDVAFARMGEVPWDALGPAHPLLCAQTGAGRVLVFGGENAERADGPLALIAEEDGVRLSDSAETSNAVIARIHVFPVTISPSSAAP